MFNLNVYADRASAMAKSAGERAVANPQLAGADAACRASPKIRCDCPDMFMKRIDLMGQVPYNKVYFLKEELSLFPLLEG